MTAARRLAAILAANVAGQRPPDGGSGPQGRRPAGKPPGGPVAAMEFGGGKNGALKPRN